MEIGSAPTNTCLIFANGKDIKFADCNEIFLNKFKQYLLYGHVTKGNGDLSNASASSYLIRLKPL